MLEYKTQEKRYSSGLTPFYIELGYESNHRLRIFLHSYESNLTIEVC